MKINGRKIEGPNIKILVINRPDGDIELRAKSVTDFEEFEARCPMPKAPWTRKPNEDAFEDFDNAEYKVQLAAYNVKRLDWLILESLKETSGLEWETVKPEVPESWGNWRTELKKSHFTPFEINSIVSTVLDANTIDDEKVAEARKRFLAGKASATR